MAGEDFGFTDVQSSTFITFLVGGVEPSQYDAAIQSGTTLPSLHSSKFALITKRRSLLGLQR